MGCDTVPVAVSVCVWVALATVVVVPPLLSTVVVALGALVVTEFPVNVGADTVPVGVLPLAAVGPAVADVPNFR